MVELTFQMIADINPTKFPSPIIKMHYDVLRELLSCIALLDGYKTQGEGAHKELIDYLAQHYTQFSEQEITLIDELRIIRNKISYDGFFVNPSYIERTKVPTIKLIEKLQRLINTKL